MAIPARALVRRYTHTYTPPIEVSPLVVQPLFDLELPSEARCREAQGLVNDALRTAAESLAAKAAGAEVLLLPPIEIALDGGVPCRQRNDRTVRVSNVLNRVRTALNEQFGPERRARVVYVYANNLDLALPNQLAQALGQLATNDPLGPRQSYLFVLGSPRVLSELPGDNSLAWVSTEEPSFARDIAATLSVAWPFRTVLHNISTVVPLWSDTAAPAPRSYRICSTNAAAVVPLGAPYPSETAYLSPPEGPAYQVELSPQILVPAAQFVEPSVVIEWQACEDLCDHPAPGADPELPWERARAC